MASRKYKVLTERDIIFKEWQGRAKELGINFEWQKAKEFHSKDEGKGESKTEPEKPELFTKQQAANRAIHFAINHLTERQAIMNERALIDTAVKQAVGSALLTDIRRELGKQIKDGYLIREKALYTPLSKLNTAESKTREGWIAELVGSGMKKPKAIAYVSKAINQGSLIKLEPRYTTKTILAQERRILQTEAQGRGALTPIMQAEAAERHLKVIAENLTHQQIEAVRLINNTANRIIGIQGLAGSGKSHMLKAAKKVIENNGYNVRAVAPYGSQVKALQQLGVKSSTVASFLKAKNKNINNHTVLFLDEAGVVPTRLMDQTLKLVEKAGARIVLIGDIAQTKAIEAGKPFEQLQKAGMQVACIDKIQRQKNQTLKKAVELAAAGQTDRSLKYIRNIAEIQDTKKRHLAIADEYLKLSAAQRERTIIISGTNEARHNINSNIRHGLKLAGQGIKTNTLMQRDLSGAEGKYAKNYYVGDIIKPERDYKKIGLKGDELYKIENTGSGNHLTVKSKSGEYVKFSPMIYKKLSVYNPDSIEISKGDLVRITRNDKELNIVNGDRFKVEAVKEDHILLSNDKGKVKLDRNKPLYIDYAYATTVHSSQGLTAGRVLIDADTKSITTSKETYYVGISRARKEVRIYTDSVKELPKAIGRQHFKPSAMEIIRNKSNSKRANSKQELFREKTKQDNSYEKP